MPNVLDALKLRTHPFRPKVDPTGQVYQDPDLLSKPLDPLSDPRMVNFYFDHYKWLGGIKDISLPDIFVDFPNQAALDSKGSVMIFITGKDTSGRKSVRNLILHKIKLQFGAPMRIDYSLAGFNAADHIRSIAMMFMYAYTNEQQQPTLAALQGPYNAEAGVGNLGSANLYSGLFQTWRNFIRPVYKLPIVLLLEGGDDHDLWHKIYLSASHVFRFIIVLTKNEYHALACYNDLDGKNRVLISANPLRAEPAARYLATRLAAERVGATPQEQALMPFSPKAVNALYERGAKFKEGDVIEWPIGWLNETFSAVMDEHLKQLEYRQQALLVQGKTLSDVPEDELIVDPEIVRAVRKRLYET